MASIREVAAKCGFSKTTVAAGLANDPEVADATRKKIQKIARAMGYHADARVSELMAHLRSGRPSRAVCNLAWVNTHDKHDFWSGYDYTRIYLEGARQRAAELGYSLIEVWMGDPRLTLPQLTRQLAARGIRGLIFPMAQPISLLEKFDFGSYAAVGLRNGGNEMGLSSVSDHWVFNMNMLCDNLYRLGYRRPALMITDTVDMEGQRAFSSSFVRCQQRLFPAQIIPVPKDLSSIEGREEGLDWVKKWRPDVVIGHSHELLDRSIEAGFRIPEDFGYVHTHLGLDTEGWAGIDPKQAELGAASVESVVALIQRNGIGRPVTPKTVSLPGSWCDGWTAPARKQR